LKTRVGKHSDAAKYKKYVRKFLEGNQFPGIDRYFERLRGDLDPDFYGCWH
jgi:hypothetical protein